jgi:phage-related baseplate assembly protein
MAAPSWQDYFNDGRAEAINRRPDLTFDEGDITEMYMAAIAAMADSLTGYFAGRFNATYLDGAQGDDLTKLADDHWNIQRFPANAATAQVTFSRTSANGYPAGSLAAGTVVATQKDASGTEYQYTTDAPVAWTLGDATAKNVNVTALLTGPASNAGLSTINRIISTPSGSPFDSSITVNNPTSRAAGGADEEADDDLRERVRNFPATLRRGTLDALEYGAKSVDGVASATAVEEVDTFGAQTGVVYLYITDASGGSSTPLINAVIAEMINWKAAGITLNVQGGSLITQDISLTITARAGVDTQALLPRITAAVAARVSKLKIGESLTLDIIQQAVRNVDDAIKTVVVNNPAVSLVPSPNQIIRAGTITVS